MIKTVNINPKVDDRVEIVVRAEGRRLPADSSSPTTSNDRTEVAASRSDRR